jgi:hypothetical protein
MMEYSAELRAGILPRSPFSFSDQVASIPATNRCRGKEP